MASGGGRVSEVQLPDGTTVYAEVTPVGGATDVSAQGKLSLDRAQDQLRGLTHWAFSTVRGALPERPDELELEFAVKLGAKGGSAMFILAETSGEASFRICMRWTGGSAAGEALGQPQP